MAPKFIFIRHGEATHNVAFNATKDEKVFTQEEFRDAPLTQKGIQQAITAAQKLSDLTILDIWCSPLTRTIQTALELFEEINCGTLYLHDNLLERLGGNHVCNYRLSKQELKEKHTFWDVTFLPEFPPLWVERESTTSVNSRLRMLVMYLGELYKDKPESSYVLLVSHNDAIWSLTGKSLANAEYVIMTLEEALQSLPPKMGRTEPW
jgi:broad specificity phosphatase PhoE